MNIFGRGMRKAMTQMVNANNDLFKALFGYLGNGFELKKDEYAELRTVDGYEKNADGFSIASKCANLFAKIPIEPYINDELTEQDPVKEYFDKGLTDFTYFEFKQAWEVAAMISGENMVYNRYFEAGNNVGGIMAFDNMPVHLTDIIGAGWRQPIKEYKINTNPNVVLPAENVWHTRIFTNLDYEMGANFRGLSPVKVAANVIRAQNAGMNILARSYERGAPPFMIVNKSLKTQKESVEYQNLIDKTYKNKFWNSRNNSKNTMLPMTVGGDVDVKSIGFSTIQDLDIVNVSKNGLRILCNIWCVPAQLFNSAEDSTYSNMKEATKAMYDNRIIPDIDRYLEGLNAITVPKYGIEYRANTSSIPALQENKKELMDWIAIAMTKGLLTGDEALVILGQEATGLPEMQTRYIDFNLRPLGDDNELIPTDEETKKFFKEQGIKIYK
jgi:HK97 family phage portal protein